ncbi:MAG: TIGR03915 family putative DNA repair protein [Cardiobacteriaceae bacterium]|nr:TIGR03915 family putative DNA repair protein [Cardiobacteriaceae bacterium]
MTRRTLIYDGSFDGLLSAVFRAYQSKHPLDAIHICHNSHAPDLFAEHENIATNPEHAQRVFTRLEQQLGRRGMLRLLYGYLAADPAMPDTLLRIIRHILARPARQDILADYGHPDIMQWAKWVKSVAREKHRMEAFVRFEALADGRYLARIAPDFDVLPLIARHFQKRYPDMAWGIYDDKRHYGICHDNGTLHLLASFSDDLAAAPEEALYQTLWQSYFQSASIASRKNPRLHRQHMPKRYWRYLTEKRPPRPPGN